MSQMELTEKSEELLHQRYNAFGVIFIKTGDKEITSFEFHRAKNGKLYSAGVGDVIEVMEVLAEIVERIPEEVK